jgi:hypothetical protein
VRDSGSIEDDGDGTIQVLISATYYGIFQQYYCLKVFPCGNYLKIDFANKHLGGGVLHTGCVQEEIRYTLRLYFFTFICYWNSFARVFVCLFILELIWNRFVINPECLVGILITEVCCLLAFSWFLQLNCVSSFATYDCTFAHRFWMTMKLLSLSALSGSAIMLVYFYEQWRMDKVSL